MPKFIFTKYRSSLLRLSLVASLLLPSAAPLQAGLFSLPSAPMPNANGLLSDTEKRYHINTESVQDQSETMNVFDNKKLTPEVSLFFSPSDPQEGQKLTARAMPIYFSTEVKDMYFTWYLQRSGCEKDPSPSADKQTKCDQDKNNKIDVNDWKIEAARILTANGFESQFVNYRDGAASDPDQDGYDARNRFGGHNKRVEGERHCYLHDVKSGENYEILNTSSDIEFDGCPTGTGTAVCMVGNASIGAGDIVASEGSTLAVTGESDSISGTPYCSSTNTIACVNGTPCCVSDPLTATACTSNITGSSCSMVTTASSDPTCSHLFAKIPGFQSGDGEFTTAEEEQWQTDPADADTADNGNKDEANVVGLGRDSFTWNYGRGDKVGVVVEGTSMIGTKYADSTNMVMWAFSKNKCEVGSTGSLQVKVKGYHVLIPTTKTNPNDCLEDNLVDPLEGGQATNLEVNLSATPDDPMNDPMGTGNGDTIAVTANVNNSSREGNNTYFDWKVYLSKDGTSNPSGGLANGWLNVTALASDAKLLSPYKGNGINVLNLQLNVKDGNDPADKIDGKFFRDYAPNGTGYLKFRVDVAENYNAVGASRRGKNEIIVKFISTADSIKAYVVNVEDGSPARIKVDEQSEICSGVVSPAAPAEERALRRLDTKLCRVVKNEIIGLKVSASGALNNFNWSINGQPLVCTTQVSTNCFNDKQGEFNFFPIIGNVGDVFTITVTANRATEVEIAKVPVGTAVSEKAVTLTRAFKIVNPEIAIETADENLVWPKILGQYTDLSGKTFPDLSKTTLQSFAGSPMKLKAVFTPNFLGSYTPPQIERSWKVDGETVGDGTSNMITFAGTKGAGGVYNVGLTAAYRPRPEIRKALQDIWQISSLDLAETYFSAETQIEHPTEVTVAKAGTNKYLALLSSYLPSSLMFTLRAFLSIGLILFITGFFFALIPNAPERSAYRQERG